jgi:serine/threonine protein kinase
VAEKSGIGMTVTSTNAGSCAWMSPERANEEGHERNEAGDVYAYGCLAYTVIPFYRRRPS